MDRDVKHISRSIYTLLDFISDVGGLSGALHVIGSYVLWLIVGDGLLRYLLTNIFSIDMHKEADLDDITVAKTKEQIRKRFKIKPPKCTSPFCLSRRVRFVRVQGKTKIEKQMDVLTVIKNFMKFDVVLKVLFDKQERYLLRNIRSFTITPNLQVEESDSSDQLDVLDETSNGPYFEKLLQSVY